MESQRRVFTDVSIDLLVQVLPLLPSSVKVVGSLMSERDGTVRLMLEGPFPGEASHWTGLVTDKGIERCVTLHSV